MCPFCVFMLCQERKCLIKPMQICLDLFTVFHLHVVSTVYSQGTNEDVLLVTLYMLQKVYITCREGQHSCVRTSVYSCLRAKGPWMQRYICCRVQHTVHNCVILGWQTGHHTAPVCSFESVDVNEKKKSLNWYSAELTFISPHVSHAIVCFTKRGILFHLFHLRTSQPVWLCRV